MTDQIPPNSPEILPKRSTFNKSTQLAMAMIDMGVDARRAAEIVNNKQKVCNQTASAMRAKYRKYSLSRPDLVKKARNAVQDILDGKGIIRPEIIVAEDGSTTQIDREIALPTASNRIAAASMVYDRYEPVKSQAPEQGAGNTYIDLSSYQVAVNVGNPVDK